MLSTTVDINWAETGFRACSFGMGMFTILMVVLVIIFAIDESIGSLAILLLLVLLLTYLLPLILNVFKLKFCDFIKGVIYSVFLSPTYVNVFTIFAISNIHDVSWGSRPSGSDSAMIASESKTKENYKNYRSNFLIMWIALNLFVGIGIAVLALEGQTQIIFYIGLILSVILAAKIIFSLLHVVVTCYHVRATANYIKKRQSTIFKDNAIATAFSTSKSLSTYNK